MNYEDISDFEINWKVAEALELQCVHEQGGSVCYQMQFGGSCMIDYCNNPSDAWPIMRDCLIAVSPDEDGVTCHFYGDWTAKAFCSQVCYTHKNPLRAAMIVFLMMQEAKRG